MCIVVVSGFAVETPPASYGGLEWMAYARARALAEMGHDVVLVASRGSMAPPGVRLVETVDPGFGQDTERKALEKYIDVLSGADLLIDESHLKLALHSFDGPAIAIYHDLLPPSEPPKRPGLRVFGVSRFHASFLSLLLGTDAGHIYNCIDVERYPIVERKEGYALWLNRINKGARLFAEMCRRHPEWHCIIAGDDDPLHGIDPRYRDALLRNLPKNVDYLGRVPNRVKIELLAGASVVVGPLEPWYVEVFGIWAVEAMACSTPVAALRKDALPEILPEWCLFDTYEELEKAVGERLRSRTVENHAILRSRAELFSCRNMARCLERVVREVVS